MISIRTTIRIIFLVIPALFFNQCQAAQETTSDCPIAAYNNDPNIQCGSITVPENRSEKKSRNITINYITIKARNGNPKQDPIVFLQGGPGAGSIFMARFFRNHILNEDRDIILVDQRGTGFSDSFCDDHGSALFDIVSKDLNMEEEVEMTQRIADRCKDEVNDQSIDINGYNSAENAADIDFLRQQLGIKQWNLLGGSYGSRLALTLMRDFPKGIRSVILTGPFPPNADMYGTMIPNFKNALENLMIECSNSESCNSTYPNLKERFYNLLEELHNNPLKINYQDKEFVINPQDASLLVHQFLYQRNTIEQVPSFIEALIDKEEYTIGVATRTFQNRLSVINLGMYMSVQAYEEVPFGGLQTLNQSFAENPELRHGLALFNTDVHILPTWVDKTAGEVESKPVVSDIATLVLAGEYDPITPPIYGEITVKYLKNGYLKVLDGEGHVQFGDCFDELVLNFLKDPFNDPGNCNAKNNPLDFR